jgi:hypothetical protein
VREDRAHVPDRIFHGVALGNWVAKTFRHRRRELVIALDECTYAVVLFPLAPRAHFRANFAEALGALLENLDFPASVISQECAALYFEPLTPISKPTTADIEMALATLNDAQQLCEVDLREYDDLRFAQLHANEYPHGLGPGPCAIECLAEAFAPARVRRWLKH